MLPEQNKAFVNFKNQTEELEEKWNSEEAEILLPQFTESMVDIQTIIEEYKSVFPKLQQSSLMVQKESVPY
jgi:hypothetical protein